MDKQRRARRPYARRRATRARERTFPWRVFPRTENTRSDRNGGGWHRLPPDRRATAALTLATAGVIYLFLRDRAAGVIAAVLLAAGCAALWFRNRLK